MNSKDRTAAIERSRESSRIWEIARLAVEKYGGSAPAGSVAWGDITDVPSTFTPATHNNTSHSSTYITAADLPATYAPTSHGNEAHSSTFITASDLPVTYAPTDHAGDHVTGGGDVIADAVAAGNSGLMSGADKTKLDGVAAGAEVNVQADWNAVAGDAVIQNKPSSMAPTSHDNTAHSTAYAVNSDLTTHTGLSTTAHGGILASSAFSGLSKITVATTAPGGPSVGDLWVDLP